MGCGRFSLPFDFSRLCHQTVIKPCYEHGNNFLETATMTEAFTPHKPRKSGIPELTADVRLRCQSAELPTQNNRSALIPAETIEYPPHTTIAPARSEAEQQAVQDEDARAAHHARYGNTSWVEAVKPTTAPISRVK
jgi:hypothetical protein